MSLIVEFSCDDGAVQDLRVANILERYGFRGTFFIPNNCDLSVEEIKMLAEKHTIGGHTVNHPQDLKLLDDAQLKYEIEANRAWLQKITGQPIDDFCYPRGRHDERVIEAVKAAGYKTARTVGIGFHYNYPSDLFRKNTSIHTYDRKEYEGICWQDYARRMFRKALKSHENGGKGYFHMWTHSYLELERRDWWGDYEEIIKYVHANLPTEQ